ncbi:uncharacterized protein JN550_005259 [Neoarthrinium moseri]|uniref:uncharacterized protein n=1 Tax=Neoarthrinium moseri TaxID=1658444 RepID=UPI001FDB3032|nr:uncharacterized protein JN550_005259 [Neoarthrinium moseri]KAI1870331.1 hypothetical protein JN550_005259 [Neoarthrinium moseri]
MPSVTTWLLGVAGLVLPYGLIGGLMSVRSVERGAIYMPAFKTTPLRDLHVPEKFGFGRHQVSAFNVTTPDGLALHAWHILPIGVYLTHQKELLKRTDEIVESRDTPNFRLLRDDPDARLVIHTHGSSGTLASSWRVDCYRALCSAAPDRIHVLTFDYRGFGLSEGSPSEDGVIIDATAIFDWAVNVAGVPPERIVIYGQSMGSGVAIALVQRLVSRGVYVAGLVTTAGFVDVATIAKTYKVMGAPVFKPLQLFPDLVDYLASHLESTWKNADRLAALVRRSERYHIELVHAQDDSLVPYDNALQLYSRALGAMEDDKPQVKETDMGPWGRVSTATTSKGTVRLSLPLYGDHDKVMSHSGVVSAIMRAFRSRDDF